MKLLRVVFMILASAMLASGLTVKEHTSYTTKEEVTSREASFVLQLTLDKPDATLFAYVDKRIVPVAATGEHYQVSWTLPKDTAKVGDHTVRFYDQAGHAALLQFIDGEGEEPIPQLTVAVPFKGLYKSKLPVPPQWIAIAVAAVAVVAAKSVKTAAEGGH